MADRYNGSSTGTSKPTASHLHRPTISTTSKKLSKVCDLLCKAKCAIVIVLTLTLLLIGTSGPSFAETGRIHITLDKNGHGG